MSILKLFHSLLFLSLIVFFTVCSSVNKTSNSSYEKEVVLQRDLIVSNRCQSYEPEESIEERFFGGETPKLFATFKQDTLELSEYKLLRSEFSEADNKSFYAHFNSDGEIHKVETSGEYGSIDHSILREIANSFIIQFPNNGQCHESGMISGVI